MNIHIPEAQFYEGLTAFFVTFIVLAAMMKIPFFGKALLLVSALLAIALTATVGVDGLAIILRHVIGKLSPPSSAAFVGTASAVKAAILMSLMGRFHGRSGR